MFRKCWKLNPVFIVTTGIAYVIAAYGENFASPQPLPQQVAEEKCLRVALPF